MHYVALFDNELMHEGDLELTSEGDIPNTIKSEVHGPIYTFKEMFRLIGETRLTARYEAFPHKESFPNGEG